MRTSWSSSPPTLMLASLPKGTSGAPTAASRQEKTSARLLPPPCCAGTALDAPYSPACTQSPEQGSPPFG